MADSAHHVGSRTPGSVSRAGSHVSAVSAVSLGSGSGGHGLTPRSDTRIQAGSVTIAAPIGNAGSLGNGMLGGAGAAGISAGAATSGGAAASSGGARKPSMSGMGSSKGSKWGALKGRAKKKEEVVDRNPHLSAEGRANLNRRMRLWRGVANSVGALLSIREGQLFRARLFGRMEAMPLTLAEQEEQARNEFIKEADAYHGLHPVEVFIRKHMLIWPMSRFARVWDVIYMLALLWITGRVPYLVSFNPVTSGVFNVMDNTAEVCFYTDICLTFLMVYAEDGDDITAPGQIAKHYLKGWFFFDLVAAFPYQLVSTAPALAAAKVVRLVRIGKTEALEERLVAHLDLTEKSRHSLRLFKLGFYTIAVAHVAACIWYYIAKTEDVDESWTNQESLGIDPMGDNQQLDRYIAAVYWAAATLTTVGYGDVSAHTSAERLFSLLMIMIGALVFGLIVGKMSALASAMNEHVYVVKKKHAQVDQFLKFRKLPKHIRVRTREYYEYLAKHNSFLNEKELLDDMSPPLRRVILRTMNSDVIAAVPMLRFLSVGFQNEMVGKLRPTLVMPGEYVVAAGDVVSELYFIKAGRVLVLDIKGQALRELEGGSVFGEREILDRARAVDSVRAVDVCEMLSCSRVDLMDLLEDFPEFEQTLRSVSMWRSMHARRALRRESTDGGSAKRKVVLAAAFTSALRGRAEHRAGCTKMLMKARFACMRCARVALNNKDGTGATPGQRGVVARVGPASPARRPSSASSGGSSTNARHGSARSPQRHHHGSGRDTPPNGMHSWSGVESDVTQGGNFTRKYDKVLRQSRVLQAEMYRPTPILLDHVKLSAAARHLVEGLAESSHDVRGRLYISQGWTWGPRADSAEKHDPELVPWASLPAMTRRLNMEKVEHCLKHMEALGFTIVSAADVEGASRAGSAGGSAAHSRAASATQHDKYHRFASQKLSSATADDIADELLDSSGAPLTPGASVDLAAAMGAAGANGAGAAAAGAADVKSSPSPLREHSSFGHASPVPQTNRRRGSVAIEYRKMGKMLEYSPIPINVKGVAVPHTIANSDVLEILAVDSHELWASQMAADGWVWGHHIDHAARRHHMLLPWRFLRPDQTAIYHGFVESIVKSVIALGYKWQAAEIGPGAHAQLSVATASVDDLEAAAFGTSASDASLAKAISGMGPDNPSDTPSRRKSFRVGAMAAVGSRASSTSNLVAAVSKLPTSVFNASPRKMADRINLIDKRMATMEKSIEAITRMLHKALEHK